MSCQLRTSFPHSCFLFCLALVAILSAQQGVVATQCGVPRFNVSPLPFTEGVPLAIATGDFNRDGKQDLAAASSSLVEIFAGDGAGGFASPLMFSQSGLVGLQFADLNGDNNLDMLVTRTSGSFSIRLGDGTGNFGASVDYSVGASGNASIAIGDLNGDSKPDLVVAANGLFNPSVAGNLTTWLGTGTGAFTPSSSLPGALHPINPVLGDFNSDGKLDLIIGLTGNSPATNIRFGDGMGGFGAATNLTQTTSVNIRGKEMNGDGKLDLIDLDASGDFHVYLSSGDGTFAPRLVVNTLGGDSYPFELGDYNNDGRLDLATAWYNPPQNTGYLSIYFGNGNGSFGADPVFSRNGVRYTSLANADFNGDGKLDVAAVDIYSSPELQILLNTCAPLTRAHPFDFDGDGRTDFTVFRPASGLWLIHNSTGGADRGRLWGLSTDKLTPVDYDGDLKTDIAVFRPNEGNWYILRSSDNTIAFTHWGAEGDVPVPAYYDNDDKADIAVWRPSTGIWYLLLSADNSTLARDWGIAGDKPVVGDYDGDAKADFAVMRLGVGGESNTWYILRSSDNSMSAQLWGLSADMAVQGDYDGDRKTDLAVFRAPENSFYIFSSSTNSVLYRNFGGTGPFVPVPGDYDGDDKNDVALFHLQFMYYWYYVRSTTNVANFIYFGTANDYPVPSAFIQ